MDDQTSTTTTETTEIIPVSSTADRLQMAIRALREAKTEIETLRSEKLELSDRLVKMSATFQSGVQAQRSELDRVTKQFAETRSTLDGCLVTLRSNIGNHAERAKRALDEARYENKLLNDQLSVKRIKLTHLSKRVDPLMKRVASLKRLTTRMKAGDGSGALTMRCIRCKARKNVIKSLEHELVEAYAARDANEAVAAAKAKEKAELESALETARSNSDQVRDQLVQLRWANASLEAEVRDEREKLREEREKSAALEATISSYSSSVPHQQQTAVVEVGRTPTDHCSSSTSSSSTNNAQSASSSSASSALFSFASPSVHAKCDQYQTELRTKLDSTTDERDRLRAELSFYQRRCEEMTLDLETQNQNCAETQKDLDAANQQVQLLQSLLENLAAGIVTAIAD